MTAELFYQTDVTLHTVTSLITYGTGVVARAKMRLCVEIETDVLNFAQEKGLKEKFCYCVI